MKIAYVRQPLITSAFIAMLALSAAAAPAKTRWVAYKSNLLSLQVSVPSDWSPVKKENALAFRYDDLAGGSAGIGILKSDRNVTIDQAAEAEMSHQENTAEWSRSDARVDGMRAIKIVGVPAKNPDHKVVHYYVETPRGMYLIQCQAPAERWSTYSQIFAQILTKLKFEAPNAVVVP